MFANGLAYRNGPTFLNIEDDLVSLDALLELAHALDEAVVVCKEIDKRFDQDYFSPVDLQNRERLKSGKIRASDVQFNPNDPK